MSRRVGAQRFPSLVLASWLPNSPELPIVPGFDVRRDFSFIPHMYPLRLSLLFPLVAALVTPAIAAAPTLSDVGAAMQQKVDEKEIAGAVTVVLAKDKILHL